MRARVRTGTWVAVLLALASGGFAVATGLAQVAPSPPVTTVTASLPTRLAPGESATSRLRGGESVRTNVLAAAGDFVELLVTPVDLDIVVDVTAPGASQPERFNLTRRFPVPEVVTFITAVAGEHAIDISTPAFRTDSTFRIDVVAVRAASNDDRDRVAAWRDLQEGSVNGRGGIPRGSAERLASALEVFERLGDRRGAAQALQEIESSSRFRRAPDAEKMFERALGVARALNDRVLLYTLLIDRVDPLARQGRLAAAQELLDQCLEIARVQDSKLLEAWVRSQAAPMFGRAGDAERALSEGQRALRLYRDLGVRQQQATVLNNLGLSARDLGRERDAIGYLEEALTLHRQMEAYADHANLLNNLGNAYRRNGDAAKALDTHRAALDLARSVKNREHEARALNSIGQDLQAQGQYQEALGYHEQSLVIRRQSVTEPLPVAASLFALGEAWHALGDSDRALTHLTEALDIRRRAREPYAETDVLRTMAEIERDRGRLDAALGHVEAAVALTNQLRTTMTSAEARTSYVAAEQATHELHVGVLMDLHRVRPAEGFDRRAFEASERGRARVLLESVHGAIVAETRPGEAVDSFAALTQPRMLDAASIQRELLDADTVLVEFLLGTTRSWAWVVTSDAVTSVELPARAEIDAAARRVHAGVSSRTLAAPSIDAWRADAAWLSRTLLEPVATQRGQAWARTRLVIVASGALEYLPFGALPDPVATTGVSTTRSSNSLGVRHEIVHLPSASVLAAVRLAASVRRAPTKRLAVLADPVFDADDARLRTGRAGVAARRGSGGRGADDPDAATPSGMPPLTRLVHSRREALAIGALVPAADRLEATDFRATKALATGGTLADYGIVHFATHAWFDSARPDRSGLALSLVTSAGTPEDGVLRLRDVYRLRLAADLVVLSACQTALGEEVKGEGLLGLTRGFLHAGSQRVVATLWQVDDAATAAFMTRFYRHMLQGRQSASTALRAAQQEMAAQPQYASPYYWAGFVLHGEWR